ncbi:hypothetical protein G3O06_02915 [Burkholderia sp. Ac-20345]|uniref:hypothetical protein n=1 Tax=Burkholderia sp. Ac-20345 TaxID=2703891 RepID=UPI00197C2A8D|nr:hypothetical protein [Burkholderia sp. Ac-20345]MBN3776515.1 hypothetical protein [Burkholderia sp. Ac-20345]
MMDLISPDIGLSVALLAWATGTYGLKFVRKRNPLLGVAWWVVTASSINALVFMATGWSCSSGIAHFLDLFTRGFGIPVIAAAGMMAVTHEYRPMAQQVVMLFGMAVVGTMALMTLEFVDIVLPYFYVAMWALLALYLVYFVVRLLRAGEALHAVTTTLALVLSLVVAYVDDLYEMPGNAHGSVFGFPVLALLTWSYFAVAIYYAYCALERKRHVERTGASRVLRWHEFTSFE